MRKNLSSSSSVVGLCLLTQPSVGVLILALIVAISGTARAVPPSEEAELLVLLAADALAPEALVEAVITGDGLSLPISVGGPVEARTALAFRASGQRLNELRANPDSPRARLERYVVLSYPPGTDLDQIMRTLEQDQQIENVEKNGKFRPHSTTPSDTFLGEQYGVDQLSLRDAWERTKGHAYIGLIDIGIQVSHPDLRAFPGHVERTIIGDDGLPKTVCGYQDGTFEGGNFRPHLSFDTVEDVCNVDERNLVQASNFGHGSHVAGVVAATTDNSQGVAGACWHCSLLIGKAGHASFDYGDLMEALTFLLDRGAQVVNMSLGDGGSSMCIQPEDLDMFCQALQYAENREVVVAASAGNNKADLDFPARDARVLAIGGVEADGAFWDEQDDPGGCPLSGNTECGSNYQVTSGSALPDLVAPAQAVLSTMYEGFDWQDGENFLCGDSTHPGIGYGFCTGTSMSSPYVAAVAGLIRSTHPLLDKSQVRQALETTASLGHRSTPDPKLGFGIPNAAAAIDAVLGVAAGQVLANRLTPLFSLFSPVNEAATHLYTSVPQMATAAIFDAEVSFRTLSQVPVVPPRVGGYDQFPDAPCSPPIPCEREPRASVFLFSTDREPAPGSPGLAALYRMSFDEPWQGNNKNRSYFYTTRIDEIELLKAAGYELDGVEGYLYQRCTPEPGCLPSGSVRLFRLYHPLLDDYVLFPENDEAAYRAAGYVSLPVLDDWIGYVYPNVDGDFDNLIDGFEALLGTDPTNEDTDRDGVSDGQEVLGFPPSDPLDQSLCADRIFHDSFDDGTSSHWKTVFESGAGNVAVVQRAAQTGPYGMSAQVRARNDRAFVIDDSPAAETSYRAGFHFELGVSTMADGNRHFLLIARDDDPSAWAALVELRRRGLLFQVRGRSRLDNGAFANTPWVTIDRVLEPPRSHFIEIEHETSTGISGTGSFRFTVDETTHELRGLDNDTRQIDQVRMGMISGVDAGTEGSFFFDELTSCRE